MKKKIAIILQDIANLLARKNYSQAINSCELLLENYPNLSTANFYIAIALAGNNQHEKAVKYFKLSESEHADDLFFQYNFGLSMLALHRYTEASIHFKKAYAIDNSFTDAVESLAVAYLNMNNFDAAINTNKLALALNPHSAKAHWNNALIHLSQGNFKEGWQEYEWGITYGSRKISGFDILAKQCCPRWHGESLNNQSLLLVPEQGIGDQIMFYSYLPDLIHKHISHSKNIFVVADIRLCPILTQSFPEITVYPINELCSIDQNSIDYYCPIGSLPLYCEPATPPYLNSSLLVPRLSKKINIGISWFGGSEQKTKELRTIPFSDLIPLLSMQNINWINLQHGISANELQQLCYNQPFVIHHMDNIDPLIELDNFFALIQKLDLVISVDNSVVHFAGSLNVPTWVLLSTPADWRWQVNTTHANWYPATKLYRQTEQGNWKNLIQQIATDLLVFFS